MSTFKSHLLLHGNSVRRQNHNKAKIEENLERFGDSVFFEVTVGSEQLQI